MNIATARKQLIILLLMLQPLLSEGKEVRCVNAGPMSATDWLIVSKAIRARPTVIAIIKASTNNSVSFLSELSISDADIRSLELSLSNHAEVTENLLPYRVRSRVDRDFKSAFVVSRTIAYIFVKPESAGWIFVDEIHHSGPLFEIGTGDFVSVFFQVAETNVISDIALKRRARDAFAEKLSVADTGILNPYIVVTGVTNVVVFLGEPNSTVVRQLPLRHDGSFGPMVTNRIRLNKTIVLTPDDILNP